MLKKEKDFEYDLMKLMKKNNGLSILNKKKPAALRIDWSKIADGNSSVHS